MEEEMKRGPIRRRKSKVETKAGDSCDQGSCAKANVRNVWIIGIAVIVLVTLFCVALMNGPKRVPASGPVPGQRVAMNLPPEGMIMPYQMDPLMQWGMQPAAMMNPNCATCPSFTQCFPQAGGMQPVALTNPNCATCPNFTQCFPQAGGMQPVALTNPNCATCPSFTQCFPQGAQAIALTNPISQTAAAIAPPIFRDAIMPHGYRGVCENCHIVKPDIPISANAQMPHEYRGVCSNCHKILGTPAGVV